MSVDYEKEVACKLCGKATGICAHCQTCSDGTETRGGPASCPECEYWRNEDGPGLPPTNPDPVYAWYAERDRKAREIAERLAAARKAGDARRVRNLERELEAARYVGD